MRYLLPKNRDSQKKAHLWDDGDTYCKMYSTGTMRKKSEVSETSEGRPICHMCKVVFCKFNSGVEFADD